MPLCILGLSQRGVEDLSTALGLYLDHVSVHRHVRAAGQQAQRIGETWLRRIAGKVSVVGGDLAYHACRGEAGAVAVAIDAQAGVMLAIEIVGNEDPETLRRRLDPLLKLVGTEVLITDDQDAVKTVAHEARVSRQTSRQHVTPNVLDFVAQALRRAPANPPPVPVGLDLTPDQFPEDLAILEWIMLGQLQKAPQMLADL